MLRRSVRFGMLGDPVEEGQGVERAGRGLGVELEREEPVALEALDGAVVQRDVADLGAVGRLDREAVVLDGDEHAARVADAHRVVRAAVAEGQLERPQAEREPEQLMAEADAEERHPAEKVAHRLDGVGELRRVARPVAR